VIFEDNTAAIKWSSGSSRRAKYIDIKVCFVHEIVSKKQAILQYVPTSDQLADILTNNLRQTSLVSFAISWASREEVCWHEMCCLAIVAGLACWRKMFARRLLLALAQDVCQAIAMQKTDIILLIFTTREISPLELLRERSLSELLRERSLSELLRERSSSELLRERPPN
jgi:hypothetical protein